jgi:hypothetical protein
MMIWWHYIVTYSDGKSYEGFVEATTAADAKDKVKLYYDIDDEVSVEDIKILTSDEDDDYRDIVIELGEICR